MLQGSQSLCTYIVSFPKVSVTSQEYSPHDLNIQECSLSKEHQYLTPSSPGSPPPSHPTTPVSLPPASCWFSFYSNLIPGPVSLLKRILPWSSTLLSPTPIGFFCKNTVETLSVQAMFLTPSWPPSPPSPL